MLEKLTEKLTISRTITQKVMREKVALLSQDAKTDEQFSRRGIDRFAGRSLDDLRAFDHRIECSRRCLCRPASTRLRF